MLQSETISATSFTDCTEKQKKRVIKMYLTENKHVYNYRQFLSLKEKSDSLTEGDT